MKTNLKLRFAIFCCALLFGFSFVTTTVLAQNASCNADDYCTPWSLWSSAIPQTVPITINGVTCDVTFTYQSRSCGNTIQIRPVSWTTPDPTTCAWAATLQTYMDNNNWTAAQVITKQVWIQGAKRIGEVKFLDFRANNSPSSQFDCSEPAPSCNSTAGVVEVITIWAKCYEEIETSGAGSTGTSLCPITYYFQECSMDGCCILSRKMCYSSGIIRVCESWSVGGGTVQCEGNASFVPPFPCIIRYRSGCMPFNCEESD